MKTGMSPATAERVRLQRNHGRSTKLRRLRIKNNLSQADLARKIGVNVRKIQSYEQCVCNIDNAPVGFVVDLAAALGCNIVDLIESDDLINKMKQSKGETK